MNLLALPAFTDNYIWMLHDGARALVVDPGDAAPVQAALDEAGLELAAILVTHHHPDHVGGVNQLLPRLQGPLYGPALEPMPPACQPSKTASASISWGCRSRYCMCRAIRWGTSPTPRPTVRRHPAVLR